MTRRRPAMAWLAPGLALALLAAIFPLAWSTREFRLDVLFGLAFVAYATVGALIVAAHPRNPVGWLCSLVGVGFAASEALYAYAARTGAGLGALPGATAAAWLSAWGEPFGVALVVMLLVFPDGRFESRRWQRFGIACVALGLAWGLAASVDPGPLRFLATADNPLGIDALGPLLETGLVVAPALVFAAALGAIGSLVIRFGHASVEQRRQLKWLALAAGYAVLAIVAIVVLSFTVDTDQGTLDAVNGFLIFSLVAVFPLAGGVAILRGGIYDIDVVINRALVYGVLTATLAGAYLASVLLLQLFLDPLTEGSSLAVAASTLAVAALFRPARARIQGLVDHRFFRHRYDAAQTLAAFGARLRDEVDLEALGADLRGVLAETVQPAHATLWLREARGPS